MGRITDNRADIYQEITDQMIAMIEAGTRPWSKSWNGSPAPNIPLRSTGVPYRGINVLTLWVASMTKGYASPHWLTFKQALALGGCVRKGEKGSPVVYANKIEVDSDSKAQGGGERGEDGKRQVAFLKRYTVFNAEQIDGIEAKYPTPAPIITATNPDERDAELDALFARVPVTLKHFGSQPYYQPSGDHVVMPQLPISTPATTIIRHWRTSFATRRDTSTALPVPPSLPLAERTTPARNWLPSLGPRSSAPPSASSSTTARTMRSIWRIGSRPSATTRSASSPLRGSRRMPPIGC